MQKTNDGVQSHGGVDHGFSLAIIHRHRLLRDCLAKVLADRRGVEVRSVDHVLDEHVHLVVHDNQPDLLLIDLNLADDLGLQLVQRLSCRPDCPKVIGIVTARQSDRFTEWFEAGVSSFVLEESSLAEIDRAIDEVIQGNPFCSPQIMQTVFSRMAKLSRAAHWQKVAAEVELTAREREVLQLIGEQMSNKQIAKRLSVSLYTVKNHVHNILEKLHVESRHGAVEYVRQLSRSSGQYQPGSLVGV
jgi:DNA-binding NarL/FixJ family response regulator